MAGGECRLSLFTTGMVAIVGGGVVMSVAAAKNKKRDAVSGGGGGGREAAELWAPSQHHHSSNVDSCWLTLLVDFCYTPQAASPLPTTPPASLQLPVRQNGCPVGQPDSVYASRSQKQAVPDCICSHGDWYVDARDRRANQCSDKNRRRLLPHGALLAEYGPFPFSPSLSV